MEELDIKPNLKRLKQSVYKADLSLFTGLYGYIYTSVSRYITTTELTPQQFEFIVLAANTCDGFKCIRFSDFMAHFPTVTTRNMSKQIKRLIDMGYLSKFSDRGRSKSPQYIITNKTVLFMREFSRNVGSKIKYM
jgi:DNA-binding HxlR family transcriptional regulator